eukprot:Skav222527  [mRNA]  locus=scaffold2875:78605:82075:+ [translate_table: standard]
MFGETLIEERRHGYVFPIPGGVIRSENTLEKGALSALNKLAGSKFNDASQLFHRPATVVQQSAIEMTRDVVAEAGPCPDDLNGLRAIQDMMKSHPAYGEPSTLAPFSSAKLKILQSTCRPKPLKQLVPPSVLPLLKRWKTHIELSAKECKKKFDDDPTCCPAKPYWDPVLRHNKIERTKLLVGLWKIGVIGFRASVKAHIGLFFVRKKDPAFIRMVVDCRISNAHHKLPPVTRLGGGANFCDFDLSPDMMQAHFGSSDEHVGFGCEMDVSDCFYQFGLPECAKWFGINDPRSVAEWAEAGVKLNKVYDEDLEQWCEISANTMVYPVIEAMPMGWTWALFFANETVNYIAGCASIPRSPEVREKLRVPQLWQADTITSVYVDNVAIFGAKYSDVVEKMEKVDTAFKKVGIPVTWTYPEPVDVIETVGVIVDFRNRVVRNKPTRLWKVFLAGRELCKRTRVRADIVEVWLGHATSAFRLCPCLLSVFNYIYRFVMLNRGRRVVMWPSVRAEIMQATALVWYARSSLGGHYNSEVDMGDSSGFGYAMTSKECSPMLIHEEAAVKEKWRFISLPEDVKSAVEFLNTEDDGDRDHSGLHDEHLQAFVRSGVGPDTEYGQWLQQSLEEGSWLRTSPILSQFRAKRSRRMDIEIPELIKPVSGKILEPDSFRLLWMRRWRNPAETINIKEARVALSSLKRMARSKSGVGCRKLTLCDNLSAVLALEKGRSSSSSMNRICKTAAALQVALQIRWSLRHVETKRNQADKPSRGEWMRRPPECAVASRPSQHWSRCQTDMFHSTSSSSKKTRCDTLKLSDLVPPPGLGKHVQCQSGPPQGIACETLNSPEQHVHCPTDDHGRVCDARRSGKTRKRKLRACWELFSGEGELTQSFRKHGLLCLPGVDIRNGALHDLTVFDIQRRVLAVLSTDQVGFVHMGTPCTVFSRARRGITNLTKARRKEMIGCELAFFSSEVARFCSHRNIFWSIENPRSSRLWEFPAIQELLSLEGVHYVDFVMCQYGQPFKKPTRIMTNCSDLGALSCICPHLKHAVVLKGTVQHDTKGWVNLTTLAGAYPEMLCNKWAQSVKRALRHASQISPAIKLEELNRIFTGQTCGAGTEKTETFRHCSQVPKLLETIVFGQHSRAEAERRRALRQKQKKGGQQKS